MTIRYRNMATRDIPAAMRLVELANWNQTSREWELFLRLSPNGCRVAERDGDVVGTVTTLDYGPFAWISMVLVHPAARGEGIGTSLMLESLDLLKDHPCVRLDATPLGEPVYGKLGFKPEYGLVRLERSAAPARSETARIRPLAEFEDVLALDSQCFDADRKPVLSWLLQNAPDLAFVRGEDGYVLGRRGRRFTHIGPLVSRDAGTARDLLNAAAPDGPLIMDVPESQESWIGFLKSAGFREQRRLLRMAKGTAPPERPLTYAIAGPELG